MDGTNQVKIDLRPPYVFAYYIETMAWVDKRELLYYSRKDNSLHFKHQASFCNFMNENDKDRECNYAIADVDISALQDVFSLMIDAYIAFFKKEGDRWRVLDGSEYTVICGRRRIQFDGPRFKEPFQSFCEMIERTLFIDAEKERPDYEELRKQLPLVKEKLLSYLNDK